MVFLIVMGVSGSGKTTIALELGKRLKLNAEDADDFHSDANKQKMSQCIPLTDEDRYPWLMDIHKHIVRELGIGCSGIIACSALKKKYRQILVSGRQDELSNHRLEKDIIFIYLKGSQVEIEARLNKRSDHFMPANLLQSQMEALEEPDESENCIVGDIREEPSKIVSSVVHNLSERMLL